MARQFGAEDAGKPVVTPEGDVVGSVVAVRDGCAYVRARRGLLDGLGSWLCSPWTNRDRFVLDDQRVATVDAEKVVLDGYDSESTAPGPTAAEQ